MTVSVVFTTILWSIGFAALVAPLVVKADVVLTAGDVIQGTSTKNVFYYSADGKRYTFPTDKVFFSWYKDWTVVKKIPDAQMGNITIGGTVAYKAGTQLVKIQTDPKVYVVEPGGTIRWVETEAIAKSLFGTDWAKKVHDVDPTIFPYVYKVGSSVNTASYPVGALVKVGSDYFYVNAANSKQKVSADVLAANGFQTKFAVTAANLDGYTAGTDMAADATLKTVAGTGSAVVGGVTPVTPVSGSGLTVALAADQPAAATIVSDSVHGAQAMIDVLKLVFTAPADGDVVVKGVTLKRTGISADTDIGNMYLFDGSTQVASNPSVATTKVTFSNSSGLFTVTKGASKIIAVKLDLKNATAAGKTINFGIAEAADVTLGSGTVSGAFPLNGSTFTTAQITDIGKLVFTTVSPSADSTVDPGTTAYEIWKFQAANTAQDIEIRKLKFTVVGSVNVGDLKNFSLWYGATQIGSTVVDLASDKTVTFDLTSAPYVVTKGVTKQLGLKADVVAGTSRNFYASFQNAADIITYDKGYNVYLKANGLDSFTKVDPSDDATSIAPSKYSINVGTLSQTTASDSPTGNIADASTNVLLAKFNWKANGEDIKVASLSVSSTSNDLAGILANVKLLVDGSQVGTTIASLTADGLAANTAIDDWGTFGNSFIIKAGATAVIKVVADTTNDTVAANDTFITDLVVGSGNASGVTSLTSISTVKQSSNTLTVKAGTVTVAKNASFGDKTSTNPTGTINASSAKVASFIITAGAGESVDVTQIAIKDNNTTYCIGDQLQNLTLKSATGVQLAPSYANPSGTCTTANTYTFNLNPAITLAAGAQYVVDVYGDLKAALTTATAIFELDSVTANGHDTGTTASASSQNLSLQNVYIASSGALLLTVDADTPVANNYLLGKLDETIAKYKISASSTEAVNITQLVVSLLMSSTTAAGASATVNVNTTGTWSNIRLYDNDTGLQIGSAVASFGDNLTTATTTYAHAIFSGLTLQVGKGVSKVIVVKADASTYEAIGLTTTSQFHVPVVLRSYYGVSGNNPITVTGASSGSSLTAVIATTNSVNVYNWATGAYVATTTLYRTKLTTAWASDTPSGAGSSPAAAQTVAKFLITNLANAGTYTATVNLINLNFSTTISSALGATMTQALTIYKDTLSTLPALATTYFTSDGAATGSPCLMDDTTGITDANFTDVDISSGVTRTFWATLDTTAAASTKTLSVRINTSGITWTDGATTSLTAMGTDLPLTLKSFTY